MYLLSYYPFTVDSHWTGCRRLGKRASPKSQAYSKWLFCRIKPKKKPTDQNQEQFTKRNQKRDSFASVPCRIVCKN